MPTENKGVDTLIHEVVGLLDLKTFTSLSASSQHLVARHASSCPTCEARDHELLDEQLQSLTPEKRSRLAAVAAFVAQSIREKVEGEHYMRQATATAIEHGSVQPILAARGRIQERKRLLELEVAAFREGDVGELKQIMQQLRDLPLEFTKSDT